MQHVPTSTNLNDSSRFFVVASFILILLATLIFVVLQQRIESSVLRDLEGELQRQIENKHTYLDSHLKQDIEHVRFLASTPPIQGIMRASKNQGYDAKENTPIELWKNRLERIFLSFISNQTNIAQIRFIGLDNNGLELVRVDRSIQSGNLQIIPPLLLQQKGDRDYFKDTIQLPQGAIYISDIEYNRERGHIEYPYWATYRIAQPVFTQNNELFGIVIINYNADSLLTALQTNLPASNNLFLLNNQGQYLIHPDKEKAFSFEIGSKANWDFDFVEVESEYKMKHFQETDGSHFLYAKTAQIPLSLSNKPRYLNLIIGKFDDSFESDVASQQLSALIAMGVVVLIGIVILGIYRKILTKNIDLAYAQSQYAAIVDGSVDGIVTIDKTGSTLSCNESACSILAARPSAIINHQFTELFSAEDKDLIKQSTLACFNESPTNMLELHLSRKNTTDIDISISLSPVRDPSDQIVAVTAILRDISEQTEARHAIEELNRTLEAQVEERTKELLEAKNEAIKASEMKSSFVANVSHEIRTPLNGLMGMHGLLKRESLTEKQREYLEMANSSAKTLLSLINDILDISKIEAGKMDLEQIPFNLVENFSQVTNSMAIRAIEKNVEVILDLSGVTHPIVIGDPLRLRQILSNLLSNAIKFTDEGEIIITARTEHNPVTGIVQLSASVQDSGIGIDEKRIGQLFSSFAQEDSSTTRKYGGTGLGLSIVNLLCGLMHGHCSVTSQKGMGSTFSFELMLPTDAESNYTISEVINLTSKVVLISGCSHYARSALQKILEYWGATVIDEDHQVDPYDHPDLIITAIGTDTQSQLERFKSLGLGKTPFIFLIRRNQDALLGQWGEDLQMEILYKPVLPMQLALKIANALSLDVNIWSDKSANENTLPKNLDDSDFNNQTLLVADDNEINIHVVEGILGPHNLTLLFAHNGQQAIDMLALHPDIELILMDCQMPVKDGFQATEEIRQSLSKQQNENLTIIAMTASAMAGDREHCYSVGMNDYITKPFSAEELEQKVTLWLSAKSTRIRPVFIKDNKPALKNNNTVSHHPLWDKESAIKRMMSNLTLFREMLVIYQHDSPEAFAAYQKAIASHDLKAISVTSHKLKGSSAAIGGVRLQNMLEEIEKASHDHCSIDVIISLSTDVETCYHAFYDEILHYIEETKDNVVNP